MLELTDGITLYHGSFIEVSAIDLKKCRQGKDFGRGFYATSSYNQAKSFVPLSINKQIKSGRLPVDTAIGYISVYKYHFSKKVGVYCFKAADKDWLHFVAANRKRSLFPELLNQFEQYAIIGGKIANDRTAQTLQLYTSGGYGIPGSENADNIAIATLLPNRLENQFCFRTLEAVGTLEFVRSEVYDIRNK